MQKAPNPLLEDISLPHCPSSRLRAEEPLSITAARTRRYQQSISGCSPEATEQCWDYCSSQFLPYGEWYFQPRNKVKTSQQFNRYIINRLFSTGKKTGTKAEVEGKAKKTVLLFELPSCSTLPCSSPDIPGEGNHICWCQCGGSPKAVDLELKMGEKWPPNVAASFSHTASSGEGLKY